MTYSHSKRTQHDAPGPEKNPVNWYDVVGVVCFLIVAVTLVLLCGFILGAAPQ